MRQLFLHRKKSCQSSKDVTIVSNFASTTPKFFILAVKIAQKFPKHSPAIGIKKRIVDSRVIRILF
jgi:hypothetical protein